MVNTPLDMKYVFKRERYLEKRKTISESARIPELSSPMLSKDSYKYRVESFISNCSSYKDAFSILETLYRDNRFDLLESATQKIINDVIPTVESAELDSCISCIESTDIGNINKDRLIEAAKLYKSIDRIRKNHKKLSKRFTIESFAGKSDKERCYQICEMVCSYDMKPFIKFNIVLEELAYLGYMDGNRIPDPVVVEHVSDYFLMIEENTKEDIDSYKRAIDSSKVLSEGANANVLYLSSSSASKRNSKYWRDSLNGWKMNPNKSIDTLIELAKEHFGNISVFNTILESINDFSRINNIEFDPKSLFENFDFGINGNEARNIMSFIEENNISNTDDLVSSLRSIWEAELNDNIYDDGTKTPETFTSNEIDKFRIHNMVSDAQSAGEFLDQLEKTSMKETPISVKRILHDSDDTDLNESNLLEHIDANGYISMKLRSYVFEGKVDDIYQLLESSIKCLNNTLYGRESSAYYTISENHFDISIRSNFKIVLSEAQELRRGFSESDKQLLCDIYKMTESLDKVYSESVLPLILDKLKNDREYAATVTPQEATLVYDILNPYLDSDNNAMMEFAELCKAEANPKYDRIKSLFELMESEQFDFHEDHIERLDFCARVMGIDEGAIDNIKKATSELKNPLGKNKAAKMSEDFNNKMNKISSDDNDDEEEKDTDSVNSNEEKKQITTVNRSSDDSSKKAINSINDAKLVWQGVKSKLKGASAKEQEMSRDLDLEFNHLLKTMKMAYTTDHREEIITGEVNHSLSKIIKIGIALAGVGVVAGNAIVPVVGAIALFAKSKYTSNKEKKMILDEIDIELQVLDREIQRAESSGSTKKYRQLLTIQKNLQRRRQEIYYGLTKKGLRVPMQSTDGMRARE